MKISINDVEFYTISEVEKKVLADNMPTEMVEDHIKHLIRYFPNHKYDACYKRLFEEWFPKLAQRGIQSIPTDKDSFAQLVFSQPDYKDRATRDAEALAAQQGE